MTAEDSIRLVGGAWGVVARDNVVINLDVMIPSHLIVITMAS